VLAISDARQFPRHSIIPGFGLSFGITLTYVGLLVASTVLAGDRSRLGKDIGGIAIFADARCIPRELRHGLYCRAHQCGIRVSGRVDAGAI